MRMRADCLRDCEPPRDRGHQPLVVPGAGPQCPPAESVTPHLRCDDLLRDTPRHQERPDGHVGLDLKRVTAADVRNVSLQAPHQLGRLTCAVTREELWLHVVNVEQMAVQQDVSGPRGRPSPASDQPSQRSRRPNRVRSRSNCD